MTYPDGYLEINKHNETVWIRIFKKKKKWSGHLKQHQNPVSGRQCKNPKPLNRSLGRTGGMVWATWPGHSPPLIAGSIILLPLGVGHDPLAVIVISKARSALMACPFHRQRESKVFGSVWRCCRGSQSWVIWVARLKKRIKFNLKKEIKLRLELRDGDNN